MGRGRQKAKHTKVARALKYSVPETNYSELERELAGRDDSPSVDAEHSEWAEYYDESDDSDDEFDRGLQQRRA